jgi:uncharacterized membrane protein (UPF0127 family)
VRRGGPLLLTALLLLACDAGPTGTGRERIPAQTIQERVTVTLPDGHEVSAEVADETVETAIGLMGREDVPEDGGMLFVFAEPAHRPFYMKGMLTSIDILWLAEAEGGGRVVHVERNVPPCEAEPCPNYHPMRAGRFVLELRAGAALRHGAHEGSVVRFELAAPGLE